MLTSGQTISPPRAQQFHAQVMELFTIPVRADTEHGCGGYSGPPIPLRTGISSNMAVLGSIEPGNSFSLAHQGLRGEWEYLEVSDEEGTFVTHGWNQDTPRNMGDVCSFSAG
ncbi:DUF4453 domain-containing protein [Gymnodinialimonas phycosphaerae]|uniref:DUF4453 domain-containing protein n=1 Tax=Gymnodinialimonas phycosphaerae TaxID=2841589 RepID=UPI002151650B